MPRVSLLLLWGALGSIPARAEPRFVLERRCPPSFERTADGRCRLVTLYQAYVARPGQGGLRAPLPPARDGHTPEEIDLGRYLFFEPLLSGDQQLSCAHCHRPDLAFTDGRATSQGHGGVTMARAAPSLWNVAFLDRFFWDGRASSLEAQAEGPLFASQEMAATPDELIRRLNANDTYRRLFAVAFRRSEATGITVGEVGRALAAFERTLISLNSRYDRYAHGDAAALSEQEQRGHNVFRGFVGRCSQCHQPPLFASNELAVVGAPGVVGAPYDLGAGALKGQRPLDGAFRVPTLRNLARTAPYFQAGQLATLEDVVSFYNRPRGHAVPPGITVELHWHVHMLRSQLTPEDAADLVAFLRTLEDDALLPEVPAAVPSGLPVLAPLNLPVVRSP